MKAQRHRFDIRENIVFKANDRFFAIKNQSVDFIEVSFKVRWTPLSDVIYNKQIDKLRDDIDNGIVTYEGWMDVKPDSFNLCMGMVMYNCDVDKYYVVIGGGMKDGVDYTRFVEAEKTFGGWSKKECIYKMKDDDLKEKQNANKLWYVGVYDKQVSF